MFAWLTGSDEAEHRMLLWQRYCDQQSLKFDDELVRFDWPQSITADTRARAAAATAALGDAKMPGLADRAAQVDREWADRLGTDPTHRGETSLRHMYSIVFRIGSAAAHPTLVGLRFVMRANEEGGHCVELEPRGRVTETLVLVPLLLGTALAASAHALARPRIDDVNDFFDYLGEASGMGRSRRDEFVRRSASEPNRTTRSASSPAAAPA
jgi:hypothetical protein